MTRTHTPPRRNPVTGKTRITVQRACNRCGRNLGDATEKELDACVNGTPLPDVHDECGCDASLAEPAEEETKAEVVQDIEVMQWDGTRKSIQAICDWVNSFDDELDDPTISYCFSSAAPDDVLDVSLTTNEGDFVRVSDGDFIVRDTQGNFYRRDRNAYATVAAFSPVVPAPTETRPWEDWPSLDDVPADVRTVWDKVGDEYRRTNAGWKFRSPGGKWQTITLPLADYDNYAPFTTAAVAVWDPELGTRNDWTLNEGTEQ